MKKLLFILIVLFVPLIVSAKATTKEGVMETISTIQNTQVDDEVVIKNTTVNTNEITLELLEANKVVTKSIPYTWSDNKLILSGGTIKRGEAPENNQYAFYIYSILESKTTAPYEETHYYNSTLIRKMLEENTKKIIEDHNTGDTFSIILKETDNNIYQIEYQYNLAGDDAPLVSQQEINTEAVLTNPNTGNIHFYITVLLVIMLGITAYTYWGKDSI